MRTTIPTWTSLSVALLLSPFAFNLVSSTPTSGSLLKSRDDPDDPGPDKPLPDNLKPAVKSDSLPQGDVNKAIVNIDSVVNAPGYDQLEDYDPDQDPTKNNLKLKRAGLDVGSKVAKDTKSTSVLRGVGISVPEGQAAIDVRKGFEGFDQAQYVVISVVGGGDKDKSKAVTMYESPDEIPPPVVIKGVEYKWQADHVLDLGYWSALAKSKRPDGVSAAQWTIIDKAVFGYNKPGTGYVPTANTRTLGKILNHPANIRGIGYQHNAVKNFIVNNKFQGRDEFKSWENYDRSEAWFVYKYIAVTKDQAQETLRQAIAAIRAFDGIDGNAGNALEDFIRKFFTAIDDAVNQEFERVLELPPDQGGKIFDNDDCSNTRYTQADGTVSQEQIPDTSGPKPTAAPYAQGTCSLTLKQSTTPNTDQNGEYTLEPQMFDSAGNSIAYDEPESADASHTLSIQSKLEALLVMTPSKDHHASVGFVLGAQKWDTTMNGPALPYCEKTPDGNPKNYKCYYVCEWGGGKSSDGTN